MHINPQVINKKETKKVEPTNVKTLRLQTISQSYLLL